MPGVPGSGGPPPKRSGERRRRNKPAIPLIQAPASDGEATFPPPAEHWDSLVVDAYISAQKSGQRRFYEPTDVTLLRYGCEAMHRSLHGAGTRSGTGMSPMMVREVVNIFGLLLFSEADRRRLRIELERQPGDEYGQLFAEAKLRVLGQ
jgi:hypothetical protein